ncbi:hypothetical protein LEP1GSC125_2728 [Leptospira mayottensis 200901122]|uniref:Uncharacterized protein n=1 Tax=Leptospira mayottensis 200901122 TaxID=1193010 RepID=A0AA87MQL5_9LEPT|nr:hypothetical protein LEP1GSC125_2728 [Leptospira mayottensis 200901122]
MFFFFLFPKKKILNYSVCLLKTYKVLYLELKICSKTLECIFYCVIVTK